MGGDRGTFNSSQKGVKSTTALSMCVCDIEHASLTWISFLCCTGYRCASSGKYKRHYASTKTSLCHRPLRQSPLLMFLSPNTAKDLEIQSFDRELFFPFASQPCSTYSLYQSPGTAVRSVMKARLTKSLQKKDQIEFHVNPPIFH